MSDQGLSLDPEIEEILRDVAADPNSMLLRFDRPEKWRGLFDRKDAARSGEPFLTLAERELLDFHREQVAELLYQAGCWVFTQTPGCRALERVHSRDVDRLRSDVRKLERFESSVDVGEALLLASRGLQLVEIGGAPTPLRLAQASYRLRPSQSATILASMSLAQVGLFQSSAAVARSVVRPDSTSILAHREECLGQYRFQAGDFFEAASHYRASVVSGAELPASPVFWYFNVLLTKDSGAYSAAAEAAAQAIEKHSGLAAFLMDLAGYAARVGEWKPTRKLQDFSRSRVSNARESLVPVLQLIIEEGDA